MKRAFRIIGKLLLVIIILLIFFVLIVFIYNKIMLKKEKVLLEEPLGEMIEVDGNNMCIYSEGEGEHLQEKRTLSKTENILNVSSLFSVYFFPK